VRLILSPSFPYILSIKKYVRLVDTVAKSCSRKSFTILGLLFTKPVVQIKDQNTHHNLNSIKGSIKNLTEMALFIYSF